MIDILNSEKINVPTTFEAAWKDLWRQSGLGFFELPKRDELWARSLERSLEIQKSFDATCVIGIGGSSLGAKALHEAFGNLSPHRLAFLEAPEERMTSQTLTSLGPLKKCHFLIVSKSGKTLETLALLDYCSQILKEASLDLVSQATVICGASSSPLRDWAVTHGVPILPVPEDVGGRFSVLSPVGLLPAALMGLPLDRLRAGAEWAVNQKNLVLQLATAVSSSFEKEKWITQMWIYSSALRGLGSWWQQLWSESLGKARDRSGGPASRVSTPMVCVGPQDQHSLLQQLREGFGDKYVLVLRDISAEKNGRIFETPTLNALDSQIKTLHLGEVLKAEVDGFLGALSENETPYLVLKMDASSPESWGAFFMIWELVIGVLGERLKINAFDQPGVELGKRLAIQSLHQRL